MAGHVVAHYMAQPPQTWPDVFPAPDPGVVTFGRSAAFELRQVAQRLRARAAEQDREEIAEAYRDAADLADEWANEVTS